MQLDQNSFLFDVVFTEKKDFSYIENSADISIYRNIFFKSGKNISIYRNF